MHVFHSSGECVSYELGLCNMARCWDFMQGKYQCRKISRNSGKQPLARFYRHLHNIPYRFQDDNAPIHSTRTIEEYKRNNNINCITWSTLEIKCEAALNFEFT